MRLLHVYSGNRYGGIETLLGTMARSRARAATDEPDAVICSVAGL